MPNDFLSYSMICKCYAVSGESKQYTILRKILSALGLSVERIDELVALVQDWLGEENQATKTPPSYRLRDDFITKAEHHFYTSLRTARQGANRGNKFWGCSSFPTCRGILPFEQ